MMSGEWVGTAQRGELRVGLLDGFRYAKVLSCSARARQMLAMLGRCPCVCRWG